MRRVVLRPHESLLLYTDGITECRGGGHEQYGDARLARALTSTPDKPTATDILCAVTADVQAFTRGGYAEDDQAVLVITAT